MAKRVETGDALKHMRGIHHRILTAADPLRAATMYGRILGCEATVRDASIGWNGAAADVCFRDPDGRQVEFYVGDYRPNS